MKPLPQPTLSPTKPNAVAKLIGSGILLANDFWWTPLLLSNPHFCGIGMSGSGKTQTLKAIAHELQIKSPDIKILIIDLSGDLELPGEICYKIDQESPHGINPLIPNLNPASGGISLQAIAVAATIKRSLGIGPNQEGLLIEAFGNCYSSKGMSLDPKSWTKTPPTFSDLKGELENRVEEGCKESSKLLLKLAASFQYGIFNKQQPSLNHPLIRFDLKALSGVPGLPAIATESLIKQLMDSHRIMGSAPNILRTYVLIDEAKNVRKSPTIESIFREGRKYGLAIGLMSQFASDYDKEVVGNAATNIVLPVAVSEIKRTAALFRFGEPAIASLQPLEALIRVGSEAKKIKIKPYYERV